MPVAGRLYHAMVTSIFKAIALKHNKRKLIKTSIII